MLFRYSVCEMYMGLTEEIINVSLTLRLLTNYLSEEIIKCC